MSVIALADAKDYLNIQTATADAELQRFIDAAEGAITQHCGPLAATSVTERIESNGGQQLLLRRSPVVSLTSVTPVGGTALDSARLYLWADAGVVEFADGATPFTSNRYDVAYTAGRDAVPPDLLMAVRETVRHLWETQRGGSRRPGVGGDDTAIAGAAYAFTYRIRELWAPHIQFGGA